MPHPLSRAFAVLWNTPALLFAFTMLFWSGNMLLGRAIAGHVPPIALGQMRWTLAFCILLPFVLPRLREEWPVVRRNLPVLALLGALGIASYNVITYQGLKTTTATNAGLLASIFPMVIAAVGFVLYRDRLTGAQAAGIVLASLGALAILSNGDPAVFLELRFVPGDLWILGAQIIYASYTVMLRERPQLHPMVFLTVIIFFGQLILMPFTAAERLAGVPATFDAFTAVAVVYLAIFPAILSFTFFNRGVKLVGSNRAAPYFNLVPIFTLGGAMLLLGERPGAFAFLGWALIVGGIWLAQRGKRPAPQPGGGAVTGPRRGRPAQ